jgi:hypothetical protein
MGINLSIISDILDKKAIINDYNELNEKYCKPFLDGSSTVPLAAVYPNNLEEISKLMKYFRKLKDINLVIMSSQTSPKYFNDTISSENTVIMDLRNMKKIPFINKRNRTCIVEAGVTWEELIDKLKEHGMRPLAPFLPRPGKSVLASALDREPPLIPKRQWDITDPLLCIEIIFGNGEIFRTGEAAGPQSIEENIKFGAGMTNPLGPGQMDIFKLVQGSKGTLGCVTWASIQCDTIPRERIINIVDCEEITPLIEFIYFVVRRRWIDEVFIVNSNFFKKLFPSVNEELKKYIMIYAINGYDLLPNEKVSYQDAECEDVLKNLNLSAKKDLEGLEKKRIESILDGNTIQPHPKFSLQTIAVDLFYNTTLNRAQNQISGAEDIIKKFSFPRERVYIYIQPVIQARAANVEFSLIADRPGYDNTSPFYSLSKVQEIVKNIAQYISEQGGFFSRSYQLINSIAFSNNHLYQDTLRKIKSIFDPDNILNRGQLVF